MTHLSLWRDNSLTLVPTVAVNKAANQSADLGKKEPSNVRRLSDFYSLVLSCSTRCFSYPPLPPDAYHEVIKY